MPRARVQTHTLYDYTQFTASIASMLPGTIHRHKGPCKKLQRCAVCWVFVPCSFTQCVSQRCSAVIFCADAVSQCGRRLALCVVCTVIRQLVPRSKNQFATTLCALHEGVFADVPFRPEINGHNDVTTPLTPHTPRRLCVIKPHPPMCGRKNDQ